MECIRSFNHLWRWKVISKVKAQYNENEPPLYLRDSLRDSFRDLLPPNWEAISAGARFPSIPERAPNAFGSVAISIAIPCGVIDFILYATHPISPQITRINITNMKIKIISQFFFFFFSSSVMLL